MPFEPIDREECIGDSLTKINLNAQNFDNRITTLENNVSDLQDDVTVVNTRIDGIFSTGMIMMWSGTMSNIPDGWSLCNGQNGTPDLRNRFVVGAGSSYQIGNTGGADTVKLTTDQLPSHNHSGSTNTTGSHTHTGTTNSTGAHTHSLDRVISWPRGSRGVVTEQNQGGNPEDYNTYTPNTGSAGSHSHTLDMNPSGEHEHTVTTVNAGGNQVHENRPPYYALAYIMKT